MVGGVELVGILNVTPDSFSDGGRHGSLEAAVEAGLRMREEGADTVDVGGMSTRPGAKPVPPAEELRRVLPVVAALAEAGVPVSIDTFRPEVASEALAAGARVVNDVRGLREPGMLEVVAEAGAGAVIMHARGTPATMMRMTDYGDLLGEVADFLARQVARARAAGIAPVWADPGLGFAKDARQSLELLLRLDELRERVGAPIYVGASRKRFLGALTGEDVPARRLGATLGAAVLAVRAGARALRVHDVAAHRQLLQVLAAAPS